MCEQMAILYRRLIIKVVLCATPRSNWLTVEGKKNCGNYRTKGMLFFFFFFFCEMGSLEM